MAEDVGLHTLKPAKGSRRSRKRVGRGEGSGTGKTAGRGHKGAGQRSGNKRKIGYEGGQNPIHMRMGKLRGPNKKMSMPFACASAISAASDICGRSGFSRKPR